MKGMIAKLCPIFIYLLMSAHECLSQEVLPSNMDKVIKEANWKRHEALRARYEPILRALDRPSPTLYTDAIFNVFFKNGPNAQKAWKEWEKKNKQLVNDPLMPLAVQTNALYLKGHLFLLLDNEPQAVSMFETVLQRLANSPADLVRFHLLRESANENLFTKYYEIDAGNFRLETRYYGSISDPEQLFVKNILPWYKMHDPQHMSIGWDVAISACKQVSALQEGGVAKFEFTERPRLIALKAESLWESEQKKAAIQCLMVIITTFPEYPKFEEISHKLSAWTKIENKSSH